MKEEAYLEEFFTEIMEAEEFGEADSKRMVAMREQDGLIISGSFIIRCT